jgi:hypothetical protein
VPRNTQSPSPDRRAEFVTLILGRTCPFSEACRRFGVSLEAGHKWPSRATAPQPRPLLGHSRRPRSCAHRTPADVERLIPGARDDYHWGARKIHAHLCRCQLTLPSARAVHGCCAATAASPPPAPPDRFERGVPNSLWQMDYKGPLAGAASPRYLLTVVDDHSRYLPALRLCPDQTMATAGRPCGNYSVRSGCPRPSSRTAASPRAGRRRTACRGWRRGRRASASGRHAAGPTTRRPRGRWGGYTARWEKRRCLGWTGRYRTG